MVAILAIFSLIRVKIPCYGEYNSLFSKEQGIYCKFLNFIELYATNSIKKEN
jgi:hypothetical protein